MKPYCFVLMPFGVKPDGKGSTVNFDSVYQKLIKPAIVDADLNPIRADEEIHGGIIHKPMFDRLMMCDYAIADLTTANANVYYELGIRHGIRPHTTILIFAEGIRLPFDVSPLRAMPYKLSKKGTPIKSKKSRKCITDRLNECRTPTDDSPVFQLVSDMPRVDIARLKTDTFRETVEYSKLYKERLSDARTSNPKNISIIEAELGRLIDVDSGIVIDLMLSYRSIEDWDSMINLVNKMSPILKNTVLVQEQLGFAYNRLGEHEKAKQILEDILQSHGPSSETNGLLGRVYKDLWKKEMQSGNMAIASGYLDRSINSYLEGFETDWRDAYPGINAVTLMELRDSSDTRQKELLPVVKYSVNRRIDSKIPDYWDYATSLEISILSRMEKDAYFDLSNALPLIREKWEPKTTANNIKMIIDARQAKGEDVAWINSIYEELIKSSL